jgi:putative flippase GtrA
VDGAPITDDPAVGPADLTAAPRSALTKLPAFIRRQYEAHRTIIRFALVGSFGYVIYSGLLFLLYDLHALPFLPEKKRDVDLLLFTYDDSLLLITTLIGTEASILGVFAGHSLWTFAGLQVTEKPLWLRFAEFQLKALVPTLGILTVVVNGLAVGFGIHHTLAVPAGFAASFMWNWLWDSRIIWRGNRSVERESRT